MGWQNPDTGLKQKLGLRDTGHPVSGGATYPARQTSGFVSSVADPARFAWEDRSPFSVCVQ